jgi:RND family efflux transporter MFP subunit
MSLNAPIRVSNRARIVSTLAIFVLVLGGGLLAGCGNSHDSKSIPSVTVAHPVRLDIERNIEATGMTQAIASVDLVARITGTIERIDVQDGATVRKGQPLFLIEPEPYRAKVSGAQGEVASAKAALVKARLDYGRQESLTKANATSKQNVDAARSARDTAAAQLTQAEADLAQARINLGYTQVTAPFDGVMTNHKIDTGGLVAANAVLATVVQADPIRVAFTLSDPQASLLRSLAHSRSEPVDVLIGEGVGDTYPYQGHLDYIAPAMDFASGTLDFRAIADNSARALLPGSYIRIRIPVGMTRGALLVPSSAVGTGQVGRYVLIVDSQGAVHQRIVTVEPGPAGLVVLATGVSANDLVVISDIDSYVVGAKVHPVLKRLKAFAASSSAR